VAEPARGNTTVRLIMPDRWLEHVARVPSSATVAEIKEMGVRAMLQRGSEDPGTYYVEHREKEVRDETVTLDGLGVRARGILSIRPYDIGHPREFAG